MAVFGTIRQKSMAGYLFVLFVILLMGVLFAKTYRDYINTASERKLTSSTQLALEKVIDDLYNAEFSQQRYVLTGNASDKTTFLNSSLELGQDLQSLRRLIQAEPRQLERIEALTPVINRWFEKLERNINLSEDRPLRLTSPEGTDLKSISMLLNLMRLEEKRQYQEYDTRLEKEMQMSLVIGGVLALTVLMVLTALYWNLHKEISTRQRIQEELAKSLTEAETARTEAENANRQKTRMLGFVSHDFKNPLAAIKRFADILEQESAGLTESQHELVGYILEGVQNLRSMVTDILDKVRLEEGQLVPTLEWINIQSFMEELKPSILAMAEPQNVQVHIHIPDPDLQMEVDPRFLRQILINLLSNAIKYNKPGGQVTLEFQKSSAQQQRQFVGIQVRDTGIGIAKEKIPHLFTSYYRAGMPQSHAVEGSGLGLAFIKQLTEVQGGHIQVESTLGDGSTFTVLLPRGAQASQSTLSASTQPG